MSISTVRHAMKSLLVKIKQETGSDFEFSFVNDGQALVETVKGSGALDLIVSDQEMPKMNGSDAIQAIRALFQADQLAWPRCPMVIATGDTSDESKGDYIKAGAACVLHKPVGVAALKEVLVSCGVVEV